MPLLIISSAIRRHMIRVELIVQLPEKQLLLPVLQLVFVIPVTGFWVVYIYISLMIFGSAVLPQLWKMN